MPQTEALAAPNRGAKQQNKAILGIDDWQLIKQKKPNKAGNHFKWPYAKSEIKISFGICKVKLNSLQGDKLTKTTRKRSRTPASC